MTFVARTSTTSPADMTYQGSVTEANKYWYTEEYSTAEASICLPNCTTYAMGRSGEIAGRTVKGYNMLNSAGFPNACLWYNYALWEKGSVPKVGAIACWDDYNGNCGHVAVVEATDGTDDGTWLSMSGYVNASSGTRSYTNPGTSSDWYFKYVTLTQAKYWYTNGHPHHSKFLGYIYNPYVDTTHEKPLDLSSSVVTNGSIKYVEWKTNYEPQDIYKYKLTLAGTNYANGGTFFNLFEEQPNSSPGNDWELVSVCNGALGYHYDGIGYSIGIEKLGNGDVQFNTMSENDYLGFYTIDGQDLYVDGHNEIYDKINSYTAALSGGITEDESTGEEGPLSSAIHTFIGVNYDLGTAFLGYNSVAMKGTTLITQVKSIFGENSKVVVLDGGGSTQWVFRGDTIKKSSDSGGVRKVKNAICIYRKKMIDLPSTVERDKTKDQLQVKVTNLRCRALPNTSTGLILGYVEENGIYDVLDTYEEGTSSE